MYNFPSMRIFHYFLKALFVFLVCVLVTSCYSKKELVYLQSPEYSSLYPTQIKNRRPDYKIQPNDVLYVTIQNPDTETYQFFNQGNQTMNQRGGNEASLFLLGYSVNQNGMITLPLLGKIKVENLTLIEATNVIQDEVDKYLRNSSVNVKMVSFKMSVLGEVNNPGYYYVYNGQCTVLEALGLAGDLTQQGNRENIKLIRQTDNGAEIILLDLTSPDLVNSKYYYMQPNDALYVEPTDQQIARLNFQPVTLGFSAIGAISGIVGLLVVFGILQRPN